jgi:hypothetical protein
MYANTLPPEAVAVTARNSDPGKIYAAYRPVPNHGIITVLGPFSPSIPPGVEDLIRDAVQGKPQSLSFTSTGAEDGWILESTETSNAGGMLNNAATTFYLGDNAQDKQYRAILSFDSSALPDNALIASVTLKIKKQGLTGTNPFTTHGGLLVDIRKGAFSGNNALQLGDFKANASQSAIATFGSIPVSNWYGAILGSVGYSSLNLTGITQFRLRFTSDDNDDLGADYMRFFSGNANAASRPQLIIEYYVP